MYSSQHQLVLFTADSVSDSSAYSCNGSKFNQDDSCEPNTSNWVFAVAETTNERANAVR